MPILSTLSISTPGIKLIASMIQLIALIAALAPATNAFAIEVAALPAALATALKACAPVLPKNAKNFLILSTASFHLFTTHSATLIARFAIVFQIN